MKVRFDTFRTPCGDFSIAVNAADAVIATAFGGRASLQSRLPAYPLGGIPASRRTVDIRLTPDRAALRRAREQGVADFEGVSRKFDLPLAPEGTVFQRCVWTELGRIPFGRTRSYGEVAATIGFPRAARAVGSANARNPICLIVPCHRVIGSDGSHTGFAFGEAIKRRLIEHERTVIARSKPA
ncbi:MAG: methylated-DNA--[protein]-cysteine S-methyltransferase [Opitutus sp.]